MAVVRFAGAALYKRRPAVVDRRDKARHWRGCCLGPENSRPTGRGHYVPAVTLTE